MKSLHYLYYYSYGEIGNNDGFISDKESSKAAPAQKLLPQVTSDTDMCLKYCKRTFMLHEIHP